MNNENNVASSNEAYLQALVDYYRNKSSQVEYEFLLYQLKSESNLRELQSQLAELQSGSGKVGKQG